MTDPLIRLAAEQFESDLREKPIYKRQVIVIIWYILLHMCA